MNSSIKSVGIIMKKLMLIILLSVCLLLLLLFVYNCASQIIAGDTFAQVSHKPNMSTLIALNASDVNSNANSAVDVDAATMVNGERLKRGKRFLDFTKGTRISWRATVKNNILVANTLWGYGFGFRANFPFPNKEDRLRPFFKRDLLHTMRYMLDGHGLDGKACILKSYCMAAANISNETTSEFSAGMLFKLLRYFFLSLDHKDKQQFSYLNKRNCRQLLQSHCPLSFNTISPYTDNI